MVEIAELTAERTLRLPPGIAARFRPSDRFAVWMEGDVVYLKRITPVRVTDVVAEAPAEEQPTPEEISAIVHRVRREKRR